MENEKSLILVVDDEPFNVDYLEQELEDLGYAIVAAYNGAEALKKVEETNPDMILLDIMMPIMDGFEVLSILKENEKFRDIPVVIISAMSDMKSVIRGIELGAEDYLPKPFDPVLLYARLNAGLERKNLKDLEKKYLSALEREFEIGRNMQNGFLPNKLPKIDGWDIAAYFKPARKVAGDFYDVFEMQDEDKIGLILGDVVDKGLGAALYMALFRTLLRALFWANDRLGNENYSQKLIEVIQFTNTYICKIHDSASYATLFFGILDKNTGFLEYVSAGHDPPIIINEGNIITKIKPTGPLVGMVEDIEFKSGNLTLNKNDTLYLFTDGLPDIENDNGEQFAQDRFEKLLKIKFETLSIQFEFIEKEFIDFLGKAPQFDDLTLVAIKNNK